MLKVGITGGIGSGKSTVCQVFETLGIPVLYADETARHLMEYDDTLIKGIKELLGEQVYINGKLVREQIASAVFGRANLLQELNAIVHPAVVRYSNEWVKQQQSPYIIKEAAIFFESGTDKEMNLMVGVYAPMKVRILRAVQRDNVPQEKILARIAQQMDEDEKMKLCDYVICNYGETAILPQVLDLHQKLLEKAKG
ncbi:MAG: dephospho-CoA kinase [Sphingobacteriales bacterium]|nr:MAG: dephospho-CoA kinase [Sphingobacteriales bacterium]